MSAVGGSPPTSQGSNGSSAARPPNPRDIVAQAVYNEIKNHLLYGTPLPARADWQKPPKPKPLVALIRPITADDLRWEPPVDQARVKTIPPQNRRIAWENLPKEIRIGDSVSIGDGKSYEVTDYDAMTVTYGLRERIEVRPAKRRKSGVKAFIADPQEALVIARFSTGGRGLLVYTKLEEAIGEWNIADHVSRRFAHLPGTEIETTQLQPLSGGAPKSAGVTLRSS